MDDAGKATVRERVWDALEAAGAARFPYPPHGRIPNFAGADRAAARLAATDAWAAADAVKANPDAPQLPVRRAALRAGKRLYVAVPRLRDERCFLELDPDAVDDVDAATTVDGIGEVGEPVHPHEVAPLDLIVSGSVAVDERGARIGKGEGYSDLEFAILRETRGASRASASERTSGDAGNRETRGASRTSASERASDAGSRSSVVDDDTTTVTTVHPIQVRESLPTTPLDVPMDLVCTPERTVETDAGAGPAGLDWEVLDDDRIAEIPVLARLRDERERGGGRSGGDGS